MGLYIKHLDTVQFNQDRSIYLYLLNYGWPDGEWEQLFKKHFMKMADLASDAGGVVVGSPSGVHFANEVLSWHRVGDLDADEVLPGLLITKTRPDYFQECYPDDSPAKPGLEELLVIPLKGFCTTEDQFVRAIEGIFANLKDGMELKDFALAQHDVRRRRVGLPASRRVGEAIELKPGMFGFSVDLKKLLSRNTAT